MTIDEAMDLIRRRWDAEGACQSCGWHAALDEYGDLRDAFDINRHKRRLELSCLSKDTDDAWSHRGVRIYFDTSDHVPESL